VRLRVLGPVEIESGDGQVHSLPRRQERALLAILSLEAGRTVAVDRLCDLLWDDNPPARARRAVHAHVAHIRAALVRAGAAEVELVTDRDGYRLRADPDTVDAHRFRGLVERAAATADPQQRDRLLREALALWRGSALHQAAASERIRQRLCADLEEQHLQAIEASIATGLELGRHRELVAELARLTAEHPTRERLVELHMLALYRSGRTVEALDVYTRTRARLADQLGLDPGPALRQLQQAILRGTPAAAPPPPSGGATATAAGAIRPAQLPPYQVQFTGRERYLDSLDGFAASGAAVVISGTAGVGKTALAVRWAHRVRDRFPDGQLYVNLRGYAQTPPLRPIDALAGFLSALDVPAERVPADVDQATALYRSLLADRRMLVLLDNAAGADQVRPLLPGALGCLALVTSRDRLGGLVARDSAHPVTLDVLSGDEARTLLAGILGAARVAAEPDAAARLATLCAHLPLALRIAAANLSEHPDRRIADDVDALRADDRLSALAVAGDDDTAVRVTFDLSYAALPAAARLLFRRLGLLPGADVTPAALAALTGGPPDDVASTVDTLLAAHLLTGAGPGRYTCHDLLRRYAAERVRADDSATDREAATQRLYDHYTRTVDAAVDLLKPGVLRLSREPAESVAFHDRAQALGWVDAERRNLVAAVVAAADQGPLPAAWHLADALRGYFWLRIALPDWLAVSRAGLAAAETGGDPAAQAVGQLNLADALARQGRMRDAIHHYGLALDLFREAGWTAGEAAVANNLGIAHAILGELPEAAENFRRALELRRQLGEPLNEAGALLNLAFVHYPSGQLATAAEYAAQAVALYEATGSRQGLGVALCSLGGVRLSLGRPEEAHRLLDRALALSREAGDRNSEAEALLLFATLYRDTGRFAEALAHAEEACAIGDMAGRRLEADALVTLGTVHQRMRHTDQSIDHLQRALALARDIESPAPEAEALLGLGAAHVDTGDVDQARRYAGMAHSVAQRAGHLLRQAQALTLLATVDLAAGRAPDAIERGLAALKVHCDAGFRLGQAQTHAVLADAFDRNGQPDAGRDHRLRSDELYAEIGVRRA
jgi:DNA-binding SARP family transcriptional activator/tetratricopeptide (TPR) repeat protein